MPTFDRKATRTRPRLSDVCLSCRSVRINHPPENALSAFRPTRVEWSYIMDADFVSLVKKTGAAFAGAINTIGGHRSGRDAVDFDGNRLVAPWMRKFDDRGGPGWACVNSPSAVEYRDGWLKDLIALGVDSIQFDDWAFNRHATEWGGCFCSFCMNGFAEYLDGHLSADERQRYGITPQSRFNYREFLNTQYGVENNEDYLRRRSDLPLQAEFVQFQRESTRKYFDRLANTAQRFRGSRLPLSINANLSPWQFAENFLLDRIDYLLGETPARHDHYLELVWMLKMADALRLAQVVSPFPRAEIKVNEVRGVLASVYALGHLPLIPWDVWPGPEKKERWFGTPQEYGGLFEFVRSSRQLFDDFAAWSNVALFVPAVSDASQANSLAKRGRELIAALLVRGIAFRIITAGKVGGDLLEIPVEPSDFDGLHTILCVGKLDLLDDAARKAFDECAGRIKTVDCSDEKKSVDALIDKAKLPPACKASDESIHALPRTGSIDRTTRVVHLINRDYDTVSDSFNTVKGASLFVSKALLDGAAPKSALYRTVGQGPVQLHIEPENEGVRLPLPPVQMWGTVEIES